jgi:hypothetical protein
VEPSGQELVDVYQRYRALAVSTGSPIIETHRAPFDACLLELLAHAQQVLNTNDRP